MVGTLTISAIIVTLILSIFFPVGLAAWFYRVSPYAKRALLVGAGVFLVFQLLTRVPLLAWLGSQQAFSAFALNNPALWIAILSLSAGVFEEIGRWVGMRLFLFDRLKVKNGIAYGIGHGGFESIVLVGTTAINNLAMSLMINNGTFDDTVGLQAGAQGELAKQQLINAPAWLFGLSGVERVMSIIFHIAMSVLVLKALRDRKPLYVLYAILLHGLSNYGAVTLAFNSGTGDAGYLLSEAWVLLFAAGGLWYIIRSFREERPVTPAAEA